MTKVMRIAMIIQSYLPAPHIGGAERQIDSLAPLLQARGCELHVITRRFSGLKSSETMNTAQVHRLPIPGPKPVASLSFTVCAMPLLQKLRPTLIHAHELLSPTTTAVAAKRAFGMPVIAKVLRGGILGDIAKLSRRALGRRRISMIRKHVDAFITISREIEQELTEIGVSRYKHRFIPNGVDVTRFAPALPEERMLLRASLGLPEGPIVVYTGRLAAEKRLDQLISIWPSILHSHSQALLLIVGTGAEEEKLKSINGQGIRFVGEVSDVAPYLKASDLFVLPSATEGLSNALLEALSCALPAVATSVGGAIDIITHGENGWFVAPDQPRFLQDSILMLLADPARRAALGRTARERIIANFSLPAVADQLVALYEDIAGQKQSLQRQRVSIGA